MRIVIFEMSNDIERNNIKNVLFHENDFVVNRKNIKKTIGVGRNCQ